MAEATAWKEQAERKRPFKPDFGLRVGNSKNTRVYLAAY
jgi:hypothetical protein